MNNLNKISNKQIIELLRNQTIAVADIVDSGICPTCFDKENNHILYGNNSNRIIYENDKYECF